jgi:hypothetical protein
MGYAVAVVGAGFGAVDKMLGALHACTVSSLEGDCASPGVWFGAWCEGSLGDMFDGVER